MISLKVLTSKAGGICRPQIADYFDISGLGNIVFDIFN